MKTVTLESLSLKSGAVMLAVGIITMILGVVAIAYPGLSLTWILIVVGLIIAVNGLSKAVMFVRKDNKAAASGLVELIFGAALVVLPSLMADIGVILFGITIILIGIGLALDAGVEIPGASKAVSLVLGLIFVILGVVMIVFPSETLTGMMWIFGAVLLIMGASWALQGWRCRSVKI